MLPRTYRSISDVGAAYQRGDISYSEAYEILVNQFGYSNNDATEYLDELVVEGTIPGDFAPHLMYDCETGIAYTARTPQQHMAMAAKGYVHDLSECKIPPPEVPVSPVPPPSNGNIPESSGDNPILETAGVFVVGVAKGTLIAAVPITAMAVAVGFMRRIVRFGVGVSS